MRRGALSDGLAFEVARAYAFVLATGAVLQPVVAQACSGPGAAERIARNVVASWALLGLAIVAAGWCAWRAWRRRATWLALASLLLIAVHPAWWLSGYSGDCGASKLWGSAIGTFLVLVVAALGWSRTRVARLGLGR